MGTPIPRTQLCPLVGQTSSGTSWAPQPAVPPTSRLNQLLETSGPCTPETPGLSSSSNASLAGISWALSTLHLLAGQYQPLAHMPRCTPALNLRLLTQVPQGPAPFTSGAPPACNTLEPIVRHVRNWPAPADYTISRNPCPATTHPSIWL